MSTKPVIGAEITLTNGDILAGLLALSAVKASNALDAVKLGRMRKVLTAEAAPIIAAFDDMGKKYAEQENGEPVQQKGPDGQTMAWRATQSPVYVLADPMGFNAENVALASQEVTIRIPLLTEAELSRMTMGEANGEGLLPFVTE